MLYFFYDKVNLCGKWLESFRFLLLWCPGYGTGTERQVSIVEDLARAVNVKQVPRTTGTLSFLLFDSVRKLRDLQNDLHMASGIRVSDQTIRNRLRRENIRSKRPVKKQRLTNQHKAARRTFAENYANWNLNQWQSVLFSDESRYRLTRCDGRLRMWGRPGDKFSEECVQEIDRFGGGSIMVWAGIMYNNRTDLVIVPQRLNAVWYTQDVLQDHAAIGVGPGFLFVHDNARAHSAAVTRDFLRGDDIEVMEWPAISPDLNPIENLWDLLDRKVRNRQHAPQTLQELGDALKEEWENIPQGEIQNFIESMPRRCQAVIQCRGGHTQY